MMASLLPTMLFAASASAQVTTSFWMPRLYMPVEHIGWIGSVIDANQTHTTIVADYDNGTDTSAFDFIGGPMTMTIGPTVFGVNIPLPGGLGEDPDEEYFYRYDCDWPTPEDAESNRTCTVSYPANVVGPLLCEGTVYASTSATTYTYTHTYPARGSEPAGTETAEFTLSLPDGTETLPYTDKPAVCSGLSSGQDADEGYSTAFPLTGTSIETYYLVITAGTEKLEATQAATPTLSSAVSTGTGSAAGTGSSSGSAALPEATVAGAPLAGGAPLLMGLGAAIAVFV
ncbi:hypothetical protein ACET3X_007886 [Alternaria dauci]|uniref:Uncharacterized protein n=1 Tax=Alternaria dauci TaxID=48095 RepID=A0ABR3UEP0_9PLEO